MIVERGRTPTSSSPLCCGTQLPDGELQQRARVTASFITHYTSSVRLPFLVPIPCYFSVPRSTVCGMSESFLLLTGTCSTQPGPPTSLSSVLWSCRARHAAVPLQAGCPSASADWLPLPTAALSSRRWVVETLCLFSFPPSR